MSSIMFRSNFKLPVNPRALEWPIGAHFDRLVDHAFDVLESYLLHPRPSMSQFLNTSPNVILIKRGFSDNRNIPQNFEQDLLESFRVVVKFEFEKVAQMFTHHIEEIFVWLLGLFAFECPLNFDWIQIENAYACAKVLNSESREQHKRNFREQLNLLFAAVSNVAKIYVGHEFCLTDTLETILDMCDASSDQFYGERNRLIRGMWSQLDEKLENGKLMRELMGSSRQNLNREIIPNGSSKVDKKIEEEKEEEDKPRDIFKF